MTRDSDRSRATDCVHAGARPFPPEMGVNTPIATSSAFDYRADGQVRYPRYFNTPNHEVVAGRLAALERAPSAIVTSSGMGAIASTFLSLMRPGEHAVLLDGIYGGTTDLVRGLLEPMGMQFSDWAGTASDLEAHVRDETRLVLVESPTNPLMRVVDLEAVAAEARRLGLVSVVDNTFASPILQNPIALGADLVVHSGTKYLGGHSDLVCGAVAGEARLVSEIRANAVRLGASLNAQDLALLERSLKTLSLRVERQSAGAGELARYLEGHPAVAEVCYPGLESHPDHATATRQMEGYGGMLSFRLAPQADPDQFLERLDLIRPAVSLGGVETTVCQPSLTSHLKVDRSERERLGIDDHLMRVSTGVEDPDDLVADLERALTVTT